MRRRIVLVTAGTLCLLLAGLGSLGSASADGEPGSAFGSFGLMADANGLKVLGPDPNVVANVSHAFATLRNGPVGYALSSTTWPGPIGGNLGSLLLILGNPACSPAVDVPPPPNCPPLPQDVRALNSPIRAESQTGSPASTTEFPEGEAAVVRMHADVVETMSLAEGTVGSAQAEELGIGGASVRSVTEVTGPNAAAADAVSRVTGISLAGGLVRIGSVTSSAHATTDGAGATAGGTTTVFDATIAGVPVIIDSKGVRVQDGEIPAEEAIDGFNEGFGEAGLRIAVGEPSIVRNGATVAYSAGSVVISWTPGGTGVVSLVLGGAAVRVSSALEVHVDPPDDPPLPPIDDPIPPPAEPLPPVDDTQPTPAPSAPTVGTEPAAFALPDGVGTAWIVLAAMGALMIGAGARRLPEALLLDEDAVCEIEES